MFKSVFRDEDIRTFRDEVRRVYREHYREMPWRDAPSPYNVFVSEVMLQQTQVARVKRKFLPFIERFPGFSVLAETSFAEVLRYWSGMGYNRRARFLQDGAGRIHREFSGALPRDPAILKTLPGIGSATAGSIAAFAYDEPTVFIETNIRRVFLHHFFPDRHDVPDREILPLVEVTLDRNAPRKWYWALMDYGVLLAGSGKNANRRSAHYVRQSPFEGSTRQLRGMILRDLSRNGVITAEALPRYGKDNGFDRTRVQEVLDTLEKERFVCRREDGAITLLT